MSIRPIFPFALLFLAVNITGAQEQTSEEPTRPGTFQRWIFGELWRSAGSVDDPGLDHIEDGLRDLLPPFVVDDLRAVRHPRGTEIAASIARHVGVHPLEYAESTDAISTDSLALRIMVSQRDRVDATAYLRVRLVDLLVGDWSRSESDLRWIQDRDNRQFVPRTTPYRNPFVRFDGLLPTVVLAASETMTGFAEEYPPAGRATLRLRFLDRRLLASVPRSTWDSTTLDLRRKMEQIDLADLTHGDSTLTTLLRFRIDRVAAASEDLRRLVLRSAVLYGTNENDSVHISVLPGQRVAVSIHPTGTKNTAPPLLFNSAATDEIRLLLGDGNDIVTSEGENPRISVIVAARNRPTIVTRGPLVPLRRVLGSPPFSLHTGTAAAPISRKVDWGTETRYDPWLDLDSDDGLFVGGGPVTTRYGFELDPYASQSTFQAGIASATWGARVRLAFTTYEWWDGVAVRTEASFAQADVTKFFGLGNETIAPADQVEQGVFDSQRRDLRFTAGLDVVLPSGWSVGIAGTVASSALTAASGSFIDSLLSSGYTRSLNFGSAALRVNRDTRSGPLFPVNGTFLSAELEVVPEFLQNRSLATHARLDARSYIAMADTSAVLVLRVSAHLVDGTVPWFESAAIGGSRSLRGYERQRFRGDASIVGGMEWRIPVGTIAVLWPQEFGFIALAESGRVFQEGDRSERWHAAAGGGFWMRPVNAHLLGSATLVRSSEDWKISATLGFAF